MLKLTENEKWKIYHNLKKILSEEKIIHLIEGNIYKKYNSDFIKNYIKNITIFKNNKDIPNIFLSYCKNNIDLLKKSSKGDYIFDIENKNKFNKIIKNNFGFDKLEKILKKALINKSLIISKSIRPPGCKTIKGILIKKEFINSNFYPFKNNHLNNFSIENKKIQKNFINDICELLKDNKECKIFNLFGFNMIAPVELIEFIKKNKVNNMNYFFKNGKNNNKHISNKVKEEVWIRDYGKCIECGSKENLQFDHIIPLSKGGNNTVDNIQILCRNCNLKKSNNININKEEVKLDIFIS